jgi:flagellar biosynthesis/type III secretory pathway protein FliH
LIAAITYIQYKAPLAGEMVETLRSDMALADPIHPNSAFAQELREEHEKGLTEGLSRGINQGLSQGAELRDLEHAENMLAKGFSWDQVEAILKVSEARYLELKSRLRSHD